MTEPTDIRVLLVDDQELVRSGLRRILRRKDGFEVVGECADGSEVPAAVAAPRRRGGDGPAHAHRRRHRGHPAPASRSRTRRRCSR
jgi:hypothetical protein